MPLERHPAAVAVRPAAIRAVGRRRVAWLAALMVLLAAPALVRAQDKDPSEGALQAFRDRQAALAALAGGSTTSAKATADHLFGAGFEPVSGDCEGDRDGDGLPDCVETATGVYVGIEDTGTDPDHPDSDGDGLSDADEVVGTTGGLDLPALGVSPLRRDLLVEFDWFDDAIGCGQHSHAPTPAVIDRIVRLFADASVTNPDGSTGINVVLDHGQGGAHTGGNAVSGHPADLPGTFDATWQAIKAANFDPARAGYFRYVLLAHRYNGGSSSSGYAEVVGDDAIVTMACAQREDWTANTVVHELGHLLGLHHGGFEACNGKPNYNSLMNYRYQFAGIDTSCTAGAGSEAGFSAGDRLRIDEAAIDEHAGVCGAPAIDWNNDGTLQASLEHDLNPEHASSCGAALRTLADFDDWDNVTLLGVLDAQAKLASIRQETGCAGAPVGE